MGQDQVVVAVIVYDRWHNVRRWIHCWKRCETDGAKLVIIHNQDNTEGISNIREACDEAGVQYIPRKNVGMDIGAFQDVSMGRLEGFPDYDYLLWATDDCLPMTTDFIWQFVGKLYDPDCGIAAMKISASVAPHVRTTGFAMRREIVERLSFIANPIVTKQHCYHFEHRGGPMTLTMQVRNMGLRIDQVAPDHKSPMWDTGYHKRLNRMHEHNAVFYPAKNSNDKITFVCTIFNTYPQVISSLLMQTHPNWELLLINDGPASEELREIMQHYNDPRIMFIETETRQGKYGHPNRMDALNKLKAGGLSDGSFVHIGNADNYYVPTFCEYMLAGFKANPQAVATYCTEMVHSYKRWEVIPCKLQQGYLDCAGVVVARDVACDIGWPSFQHSSDWEYFKNIGTKYGFHNFIPVKGCLLIHN